MITATGHLPTPYHDRRASRAEERPAEHRPAKRRRQRSRPRPHRHRRPDGFTLMEVLIATIILALGLLGLAAVFPVVITQQKEATDASMALSAGESGEALLQTRLGDFATTIARIDDDDIGTWYRVNAFDPGGSRDLPYLRMPDGSGNQPDLRLVRTEEGLRPGGRRIGNTVRFDAQLRHSPLREPEEEDSDRFPLVRIFIDGQRTVVATPDVDDISTLRVVSGAKRFLKDGSVIDYQRGRVRFDVDLSGGETLRTATIDYQWLDDRLLSHRDRLSPLDNPRYAWDVLVRQGRSGQAQYCLFLYRFDGPADEEFTPDTGTNETRDGMLRRGDFSVTFDRDRQRFVLRDPTGREERRAMQAGVYLLPVEGSAPVQVVRRVRLRDDDNDRVVWELDAPPTRVEEDGEVELLLGNEEYWYMPLSVRPDGEETTWRITPILAYTKQVDL